MLCKQMEFLMSLINDQNLIIPLRECQNDLDQSECCCYLKKQATAMIQIYETILCTRECKIHNFIRPQYNAQGRNNWSPRGGPQDAKFNNERAAQAAQQAVENNPPAPAPNNVTGFLTGQGPCMTCGRFGHESSNCRMINEICFNCNMAGHILLPVIVQVIFRIARLVITSMWRRKLTS
jgi:hypothetical protein